MMVLERFCLMQLWEMVKDVVFASFLELEVCRTWNQEKM